MVFRLGLGGDIVVVVGKIVLAVIDVLRFGIVLVILFVLTSVMIRLSVSVSMTRSTSEAANQAAYTIGSTIILSIRFTLAMKSRY